LYPTSLHTNGSDILANNPTGQIKTRRRVRYGPEECDRCGLQLDLILFNERLDSTTNNPMVQNKIELRVFWVGKCARQSQLDLNFP
jgi:hypothetical protein